MYYSQVTLTQFYKLSFSEGRRKILINSIEINNGFPVTPGGTLNQVSNAEFDENNLIYSILDL